ncbi:hypothetical protein [Siccirubricoccus sp. G192]|uniref:hypothetical protein n=1 Tax=Siccirubricoccus sp. G192 TaxID=2849651 RepID=UPI001C2BE25B|nr:hypothetical protein [Siccirubricoccus sp. G192]MBV1797082.1 hypothetical protein [Siccirubricoccus sp. G192]
MTAARRAVPRAAAPRPAARPRAKPAPAALSRRARWVRVALLVAAVLLGLPLAHAMFGEVVALLGGTLMLGFWLGRWTMPGR